MATSQIVAVSNSYRQKSKPSNKKWQYCCTSPCLSSDEISRHKDTKGLKEINKEQKSTRNEKRKSTMDINRNGSLRNRVSVFFFYTWRNFISFIDFLFTSHLYKFICFKKLLIFRNLFS